MNIGDIDRKLLAGINLAFLLLIFLLPLLVSTRSSEVFELPKMLFVYTATAIIVGLWLGRMVLRREILIRQTPLDIPILLFLISQMASTIYSIDPYVSWWGWYGRFHGGLISTISYTLLYYAFVSNLSETYGDFFSRTVKQHNGKTVVGKPVHRYTALPFYRSTDYRFTISPFHRLLIKVILSSALVVSAYAVLQHFGVDKDFWVQDVVNRVFSTQGQPNWLAAYLVMTIPLVFVMIISSSLRGVKIATPRDVRRPSARHDGKIKIISYFLFLIYTLALLWTKSRSGLAGLAAADLAFWFLILFNYFDPSSRVRSKATNREIQRSDRNIYIADARSLDSARDDVIRFLAIHLLFLILILTTNNPVREWMLNNGIATGRTGRYIPGNDGTTNGPAMETGISLRKSEHGGTESGDIRRIVWNGAIQLVKQRPVFGFGPETFGETYWRVRPKEHNLTSEWNFLYNKAHNEWLNLAANTGLFGLGSHLLLLGWFSVWSILRLKVKNEKLEVRSWNLRCEMRKSHFTFQYPASQFSPQTSILMIAAILAALIGVEAVNFFGFSTVTVGTYRYLFMAAAVAVAADDDNKLLKTLPDRQGSSVIHIMSKLLKSIADRIVTSVIQERNKDKKESRLVVSEGRTLKGMILKGVSLKVRRWQYFLLASIVVGVFWVTFEVFIRFRADLAYNRGRAYQDAGYIEEAVEPLMRAVNLVPEEPVFRAELAEAEGSLAALLPARLTDNSEQRTENPGIQRPGLPAEGLALSETIARLKNYSIANFEIVRRQSPQNLGFIRTEAKVLFLLGNCADNAVAGSLDSPDRVGIARDDDNLCEEAIQLMKLAMGMAPTNPQLPYSLGLMLTKMGQEEEAAVYFMKALELKPDWAEAREKLKDF